MFRHDPNAMLYAPPRVLLYSNAEDEAVFGLDQPSTVFSGLGTDEISTVALRLGGQGHRNARTTRCRRVPPGARVDASTQDVKPLLALTIYCCGPFGRHCSPSGSN